MKCKEIQEKQKIKLQLKNKKKVQSLKEKGITLIALVVTIIILLILAGVTLNMAMSGEGLFSRARNAADKYKKAQEDEAKLISEIGKEMNDEYVGAYIEGYKPTGGTCTITKEQSGIGDEDTVNLNNKTIKKDENGNQTFTTDTDMKWRIWDYDGTTLRIISDKTTKDALNLANVNGYNYGVWALNEICRKCYGQDVLGVSVLNLRRSDIEEVGTYDYTKYKHGADSNEDVTDSSEDENLIHYGETKTYEVNFLSPAMWENDAKWNYRYDKDKKIGVGDPSCENEWELELLKDFGTGYGKTDKNTEFKQSIYTHDYKKSDFKNENYYDMLFNSINQNSEYDQCWIGTRYTYLDSEECHFGLSKIQAKKSNLARR